MINRDTFCFIRSSTLQPEIKVIELFFKTHAYNERLTCRILL